MADIEFICPKCQNTLLIEEQDAGERVNCPQCGSEVVVPVAGSGGDQSVSAEEQPVAPKRCPNCQQEVEAGAVPCVNCGTNLVTGKKLAEPSADPAQAPNSSPGIGRAIFAAAAVLVLLLGGLWWMHKRHQAEDQAQELAQNTAAIEAAFNAMSAHLPRSNAELDKTITGLQALVAKAAASGLPEWQTRCDAYAAKMKERRTALTKEFHSLSNDVAALDAKHDFRAAVNLLKGYKRAFAVETEKYRNEQIALLERKAAQSTTPTQPQQPATTSIPATPLQAVPQPSAMDAVQDDKLYAEVNPRVHYFSNFAEQKSRLESYIAKFPNGKHIAEIRALLVETEKHLSENQKVEAPGH